MKSFNRFIIAILFISMAFTSNAQGDKESFEPTNAIKFNILSPFYQNLNIAFQHVKSDDASYQLGLSYMDFDGAFFTSNGYNQSSERTTMLMVTPEYRFNINGMNLSGMYIGVFGRYINLNYSYIENGYDSYAGKPTQTNRNYIYNSMGIGMLFGTQTIIKKRITVDAFAGPVYGIMLASNKSVNSNSDIVLPDGISTVFLKGYGVRAGLTVGFAF